jgi:hypothetical protein
MMKDLAAMSDPEQQVEVLAVIALFKSAARQIREGGIPERIRTGTNEHSSRQELIVDGCPLWHGLELRER